MQIEETRFPNIHVRYDIQDSEFSLPPLTVQPLVENAIRHGVRIRDEGIVEIVTRKLDGCHKLVIRDNGTGFDTGLLETADPGHIGLRNVRERIGSMCGGTLSVESRPGEGTTIVIRIPFPEGSEEMKA